jgi:PAS domain S-box-containing protein
MRLLISGSVHPARSQSVLQAELESPAAHGFSYITVYSPAGEDIAQSGERYHSVAFEIPVTAKPDTALLWRKGVYLRDRQELRDEEGILGTADSLIAQDQHFVYCNPALAKMLGYTIEEILTLPFGAVIAPGFIRTWNSRYKQRINFQEKEPLNKYEIRIIPKINIADIWVELHAERIYYNNRPAALYILRDMTEQKKRRTVSEKTK